VDLKELVSIAQRRWLSIVVFFIHALVTAAANTFAMTPQ
jgi:capsular polysaccharide biosynthesis protein